MPIEKALEEPLRGQPQTRETALALKLITANGLASNIQIIDCS